MSGKNFDGRPANNDMDLLGGALLQSDKESAGSYLIVRLFFNLSHGGRFEYQREGLGPILGPVVGFTQKPEFRSVADFNVGLFSQQAGLSLKDTLSIAGRAARIKSSNGGKGPSPNQISAPALLEVGLMSANAVSFN